MLYKLLLFFIGFGISPVFAQVPESIKREYAAKMHQAFALQSVGKATQAFLLFQEGYQQAIQVGESPKKVEVIHQLFYWYRKYGTSLHLMLAPSGISDEYRRRSLHSVIRSPTPYHYQSEWGKDPEQAGNIRNLMVGFGEIISSVFCVAISPTPVGAGTGIFLLGDGVLRIWDSFNSLLVQHELSLKDESIKAFQQWEAAAKKVAPKCPCEQ